MAEHHHHHVAVIPFPFASHPASLFNVTKHLATLLSGSDVHFTFFSIPKSNSALSITSAGYDNIKSFDISDGLPPEGFKLHAEEVGFFMRIAPNAVRAAVAQVENDTGRKFTWIIGDPLLGFLADMADEMNIPWVGCWVSGLLSLQTHVYTDLIRHKIGVGGTQEQPKDKLISFVPGLSNLRVRDLPIEVISSDIQSPIVEMLRTACKILSRASVVIANTFEELDPELLPDLKSNLNPNFLCTGPFNLINPPSNSSDPHKCILWLDKQPTRSVVYIGFGNVTVISVPEMLAIADALEEAGVRFLWSLKLDQMSSFLPASFVTNAKDSSIGMFVPWAPQRNILEHPSVGAHMTHFGWNSVTESLYGGVPMIGRPSLSDQPVSARMTETTWGCGIVIDENGVLTKFGVRQALEKVLKDGEEMRRIMDNMERLKNLIKAAVQPKGSSYENYKLLAKIIRGPSQSLKH